MKQVIVKINDLIDDHGDNFTHCTGCDICTEIDKLRKHLEREPVVRFNHILQKGQDMTKSDIQLLLENSIGIETIRKALGMGMDRFQKVLESWGFRKKREEKEVAKLQMTAEEFVQLKYIEGKSMVEIGKLKRVSDATIHNWRNKNKEEINRALEGSQKAIVPPKAKSIITPKEDKTAEYERLINELKQQLASKDAEISELNNRNAVKNIEYENLHASIDDVEGKLSEVKKRNDELETELQATVSQFHKAELLHKWHDIELEIANGNARAYREKLKKMIWEAGSFEAGQ